MADQEHLDILKQGVKYGTNGEESILLWYLTSVLQTLPKLTSTMLI
jgi:hypothetical protein